MANNNHFNLTLDTIAPIGEITRPAHYVKDNTQSLVISYTTGDAVLMKVWFTATAIGSESDASYPNAWEVVAATKLTNFTSEGTYYYHVQFLDGVNNKSLIYNTDEIIYDRTAPVINSITLTDPTTGSHIRTKSFTINWSFAYTETYPKRYVIHTTDVATDIDITGNIPTSPVTGTLTFDAGAADGTKTVNVTMYDEAGNVSAAASQTIILDTQLDVPVIAVTNIPAPGDDPVVIANNSYINYHGVRVNATDSDTGVIKYRIYEVIAGQNPPAYTTQTAGTLDETVDLTLSNNDGQKTIRVDVEDETGNTQSATFVVNIDTALPIADIQLSTPIISEQAGYNTAHFTLTGTDAFSGVKGYEIWCNNTRIVNMDGAVPATYDLTSAQAVLREDDNDIKLVVFDNAGNKAEDTVTLIFDTMPPSITIGALPGTSNGWYNTPFDVNLAVVDGNVLDGFYIWVNNTEVDTDITGHTKRTAIVIQGGIIDHQNIEGWSGLTDSATCYLHVVAIDSVANSSSRSAVFKYDDTAPVLSAVNFSQSAYNSTAASISIVASDATSLLDKMQVTGDITNGTASGAWESFASTRAVTLTTGDGNKTVTVLVKDKAGNVSSAAQDTCELDMSNPIVVVTLFEADGVTPKAANSPVPTFVAHIQVGDDTAQATGDVRYKVYGDYTVGGSQSSQGTPEPADYSDFIPDPGKLYYTLTGICTSNPAASGGRDNKIINVKAIDNAGNTNAGSDSFYYDTKIPEVTVTNIDYQFISKEHEYRYSGATQLTAYADETNFTIVPDESIIAYKVCAYIDAADAVEGYPSSGTREQKNAWVEAQNPIPSIYGSIHMSGSIPAGSSASIYCMINGNDFEGAIIQRYQTPPENVDGAHVVVVYVKDLAGTWSTIADFTVTAEN